MGKEYVKRGDRTFIRDGNKYAGSVAMGGKDAPTPSDVNSTTAVETPTNTVPDYSSITAVFQDITSNGTVGESSSPGVAVLSLPELDEEDRSTVKFSLENIFPNIDPDTIKGSLSTVNVSDLDPADPDDYEDNNDYDRVDALIHAYTRESDIPPIIVVDYGEDGVPWNPDLRYDLIDGCHRASAANAAHVDMIPAYIILAPANSQ